MLATIRSVAVEIEIIPRVWLESIILNQGEDCAQIPMANKVQQKYCYNLLLFQQMNNLGNLSIEFLLPEFEAFNGDTFHWARSIGDLHHFKLGR